MPRHPGLDLEHFLPYRLSVLSNRISQPIARLRAALRHRRDRMAGDRGARPLPRSFRLRGRRAHGDGQGRGQPARSRACSNANWSNVRQLHGDDRRRSVLALSRAGRRIYDDQSAGAGTGTAPASRPDRDERAALDALLDKLADGIEHLADAPP